MKRPCLKSLAVIFPSGTEMLRLNSSGSSGVRVWAGCGELGVFEVEELERLEYREGMHTVIGALLVLEMNISKHVLSSHMLPCYSHRRPWACFQNGV